MLQKQRVLHCGGSACPDWLGHHGVDCKLHARRPWMRIAVQQLELSLQRLLLRLLIHLLLCLLLLTTLLLLLYLLMLG